MTDGLQARTSAHLPRALFPEDVLEHGEAAICLRRAAARAAADFVRTGDRKTEFLGTALDAAAHGAARDAERQEAVWSGVVAVGSWE